MSKELPGLKFTKAIPKTKERKDRDPHPNIANLFSLTAFKKRPEPQICRKFVSNLSRRLFLGVPIRGAGFCQKFDQNLSENYRFSNVDEMFDKFQPA